MNMMEDIINKLIDIDKMSKKILIEQNNRKENIDELIETEIEKQKLEINAKFDLKLKMKNEEMASKLEENKKKLIEIEKNEIIKLEKEYSDLKEVRIQKVISKILNGYA